MAHHLKTMLRIVNISGATARFGLCKCVVSDNEDVNLSLYIILIVVFLK